MSRSAVSQLVEGGHVLVDGNVASKSDRLHEGSWMDVALPSPKRVAPPTTSMDILLDDPDFVVVNKPVGVAAHTGPGWDGPTVLGNLEAAGISIAAGGPQERKGIVSRLDVGTSGAMVVAKSDLGYSKLKNAFRNREVEKVYHAVVSGHPDPPRGTIDAPIGRHPSRTWRMAVLEGGKAAITHYDTEEYLPGAALLSIHLETGRTHQIRVHMAAIGHPCVGDVFYGADPKVAETLGLERQWLHARELGFAHPRTGEMIHVQAPYAYDLTHALDILRA